MPDQVLQGLGHTFARRSGTAMTTEKPQMAGNYKPSLTAYHEMPSRTCCSRWPVAHADTVANTFASCLQINPRPCRRGRIPSRFSVGGAAPTPAGPASAASAETRGPAPNARAG